MLFERGDLKCYSSGSFHDAKRSGYGFETCINRRHYKGVEAIKQAHEQMEGEYYNFYEGNFHDNQFAGEAICKYEDGRKIRGIFTKGQPSGVAHMKEVDGKEYLMNFIHGAVGGRTLFKKADRVYEFYWKNNKTEGKAASYA